ncbi:MAG: urease accessory protein UreD [Anaerolineae bacterium]|nr:urease accessory protein UreD [Anaerolineae bacterium]
MSLGDVGRDGVLKLTFDQQMDSTVLVENYSRPPLQVMRPILDAADCLCVYLLSPTGGIVQGDRYRIEICVGDNTHVLFTTQSATKVYRMPQDYAEQIVDIDVGRGAIFEFVPDASILFADADFRQQMSVNLQPGAVAILYEIVMPGRVAKGEHLRFRRYANRLVVRDAIGLLLYDTADIQPMQLDLTVVGRLEGFTCWGSLYLVGDLEKWNMNPTAFCEAHRGVLECEGAIGSISSLYRNGLCVRMLSNRLETIYKVFDELRAVVRTQYMNLRDAPLRK